MPSLPLGDHVVDDAEDIQWTFRIEPQLRATTDIEAVVAAIEDDQCSVQVLADHCRFVGIAAPQRDAVTAARYRTRSTRSDPARMPATPRPASPSPRIRAPYCSGW